MWQLGAGLAVELWRKKAPELCSPTLSSAGPCLGLWAADGLQVVTGLG